MGNVCLSKHGKGTVKTQHKRWKMVHLCRTLTMKGVCRTGSCSEWVSEWVLSECEGRGTWCTVLCGAMTLQRH